MGTGWRLRNNVVFGRLEAFGERVAWIARLNRNEVFAKRITKRTAWTTGRLALLSRQWFNVLAVLGYAIKIALHIFALSLDLFIFTVMFYCVEFRWRIFWILSRRFCSSTSLSGLTLEAEHALQDLQVARCCRVPKTSHIPPQDTFGAMSYNELKMIHDRHQRKSAFIVSREGPKFRKSSKSWKSWRWLMLTHTMSTKFLDSFFLKIT